jgi:hypothetical protein
LIAFRRLATICHNAGRFRQQDSVMKKKGPVTGRMTTSICHGLMQRQQSLRGILILKRRHIMIERVCDLPPFKSPFSFCPNTTTLYLDRFNGGRSKTLDSPISVRVDSDKSGMTVIRILTLPSRN